MQDFTIICSFIIISRFASSSQTRFFGNGWQEEGRARKNIIFLNILACSLVHTVVHQTVVRSVVYSIAYCQYTIPLLMY